MAKLSAEERFWLYVSPEPNSGCWLWIGSGDRRGYGSFSYQGRSRSAHRWAYEHYMGPIPDGMMVCHKCDVPACVNPDHLFLGTNSDNMKDCYRKGRNNFFWPPHKLTDAQSLEIRMSKELTCVLVKRYGVTRRTIQKTRRGEFKPYLVAKVLP